MTEERLQRRQLLGSDSEGGWQSTIGQLRLCLCLCLLRTNTRQAGNHDQYAGEDKQWPRCVQQCTGGRACVQRAWAPSSGRMQTERVRVMDMYRSYQRRRPSIWASSSTANLTPSAAAHRQLISTRSCTEESDTRLHATTLLHICRHASTADATRSVRASSVAACLYLADLRLPLTGRDVLQHSVVDADRRGLLVPMSGVAAAGEVRHDP